MLLPVGITIRLSPQFSPRQFVFKKKNLGPSATLWIFFSDIYLFFHDSFHQIMSDYSQIPWYLPIIECSKERNHRDT